MSLLLSRMGAHGHLFLLGPLAIEINLHKYWSGAEWIKKSVETLSI